MPQYQSHNAMAKNRVKVPRREHWLVRNALGKLKVRYWVQVWIWNPLYTGMRRRVEGGYQWLEFVIQLNGKPAAIFFPVHKYHTHDFERRAIEEKKAFLEQKGIPYLIVPRTYSQIEYEVTIEFWMRKEKRKYEKQIRRAG